MAGPDRSPRDPSSSRDSGRRGGRDDASSSGTDDGGSAAAGFRPWLAPLLYAGLALLLLWAWGLSGETSRRSIPYSEFKQYLTRGEVVEATVGPERVRGRIVRRDGDAEQTEPGQGAGPPDAPSEPTPSPPFGGLTELFGGEGSGASEGPPPQEFAFETVRVEDPDLVGALEAHGVRYDGSTPGRWSEILSWLLPIGLLVLVWVFLLRRLGSLGAGGMGQQAMSFGRSRARIVADRETGVRFDDVAGCDEAKRDLQEVVRFLRRPDRYEALGARIPKGVLLVGPPGTGKTLLARAVAGEAGVPFFELSGSEFVEMFVGVGAARVRDLFEQAKKQAPCIVFIDELDAIGRARGVSMGQVHEEREQTLNQLLVEMDGFEANAGVIVLSATNRPEILDRALLRPGRFDRQVLLDAPNFDGRLAILRVHARGKPLAPDADLERVARATPGMSGADLANVVNEAALLAASEGDARVQARHLEEAVERVVAGPERRSRRLSEEDKRRVAVHESGHAVVAAFCEHADPVHKITIVPRGRAALGYTMQLPTGDQYLLSRSALLDKVRGLMGGRAAEELVLGEVSTGAENDLDQATTLVRQMVAMHGMGESVRLAHCARPSGPELLGGGLPSLQRDCSDETAREIDQEVVGILDAAYADARRLLEEHRPALDRVVETLIAREALDEVEFRGLVEEEEGRPPDPAAAPGPA